MKEGENLDWGNEELFLHEIDKQQEWIKLEKKLIERKRNRRFLILFFFLGFLGLGASVYHYMSPLDTTFPSINHELAVQQDLSSNPLATQNSNPILNADIIPAKEQINQNSIKQSQENIFKVRTQNQNKAPLQNLKSGILPESNLNRTQQANSENGKFDTNSETISDVISGISNQSNEQTSSTFAPESTGSDLVTNAMNSRNQIFEIFYLACPLSIVKSIQLDESIHQFDKDIIPVTKSSIKPNSAWIHYFEASIGYGLMNYKQNLVSNESLEWANNRKQSEKAFDSYVTELKIGRRLSPNINLSLGLNYRLAHTKVKEQGVLNEKQILKDQIIEYQKQGEDIINIVRDDVEGSVIREFQTVFYNRYSSLSVPLGISGTWKFKYIGNLSLEANLLFGVYHKISGYLPSVNEKYRYQLIADNQAHQRVLDAFSIRISKNGFGLRNFAVNPFVSFTSDFSDRFKDEKFVQKNRQLNLGLSFVLNN